MGGAGVTEIKRWEVDFHGGEFIEHPNGEWVRWEDVRGYILAVEQMAKDLDLDALKGLLCARPKVEEAP